MTMRMKDQYPEFYAANGVRILGAMQAKAQRGELPGCAPVGYKNHRLDSSTTEVVEDEIMALLVAESFELADTTNYPIRHLLAMMTEKGLVSRNGKSMGVSAFWKMLTNPLYCGLIRYKGQLIPGKHPRIISESLFYRVKEKLASRGRS